MLDVALPLLFLLTSYTINYYSRGGEFEGGSGVGVGLGWRGSADFSKPSKVVKTLVFISFFTLWSSQGGL